MKLRDWLLEHGIKQCEFAARVDVGRAHLSCIIAGKRNAGRKLARNIERETHGEISAGDVLSGESLGYEGKRKRVADIHVKVREKDPCRKVFSLI